MNASDDWDVIWKWQWFRRALWQPHFRDPKHPEGRPARTAPVWSHILRQYGAQRVLDCNCGLGLRAILLQQDGFDVAGTDSSGVAIQHARELAEFHELPIRFEHCAWEALADRFHGEFDAVINDAFAWTTTRHDLRFATHNFASVLKPGGVLIFTGCDQSVTADDRAARIESAWNAAPRFQIRADYDHGGTHLTLLVVRDRHEMGVVENYLFVVREDGSTRLETAAICNSVHWAWEDYKHVCDEAEFVSLETVSVPGGAREHHLNVATR
jgi:SAM-dependent methyltransferase